MFSQRTDKVKPAKPEFSWPDHRGVAGVPLLFGEATHPGKAHPSVDRRETQHKLKGTPEDP
jgi:hypothetical protein